MNDIELWKRLDEGNAQLKRIADALEQNLTILQNPPKMIEEFSPRKIVTKQYAETCGLKHDEKIEEESK